MKLRSQAAIAAFLTLTAAGYVPASHAAGHHASGGEAPPATASGGQAPVATAATSGAMPASEQLANTMAAARGWDATQQACLDNLWTEESAGTWSPTVVNPASGAYGIPQALPASKLADPAQGGGPDWRTSAATQVRWGLDYIAGRYGTPCGAWRHETSQTPNWY